MFSEHPIQTAGHRLNRWKESSGVGLFVILGGFLFPAENLLDLF
jgi:hypothetical protein